MNGRLVLGVPSKGRLQENAQAFFARAGLPIQQSRGARDYRIVESLGATEGAPASGEADAIVDITTTGATLAANALKILDDGVILRSEANLVASLAVSWGETERALAAEMLNRIAAETRARRIREVCFTADDAARIAQTAAERFPGTVRLDAGGKRGILHCPADALFDLARFLHGEGAVTVTAARLDYVFEAENPLLTSFLAKLDKAGVS